MVNKIDIRTLNMEELSGVVNLYPWFGYAHMEMCARLASADAITEAQIAQAALHVCSRKILQDRVTNTDTGVVPLTIPLPRPASSQRVRVIGGDYFSQEEYNSVRQSDDGAYRQFDFSGEGSGPVVTEDADPVDFCTETLARIYLEQGYVDAAVDIYSKLSLRYPEKSVYFAALIDEIEKNR